METITFKDAANKMLAGHNLIIEKNKDTSYNITELDFHDSENYLGIYALKVNPKPKYAFMFTPGYIYKMEKNIINVLFGDELAYKIIFEE